MSDWPSVLLPPFKIVTPWSEESLGNQLQSLVFASGASGTVVQNQAYYFPFRIDIGATAVKMAAYNGATANGNTDVGIYDEEFNYIISSGATAQAGTSALQEFDITDTALPAGFYWMALSTSSATATFFRLSSSIADELSGPSLPNYIQTSAHPLPTSTATPAISADAAPIYAIGMGVSFDTLI